MAYNEGHLQRALAMYDRHNDEKFGFHRTTTDGRPMGLQEQIDTWLHNEGQFELLFEKMGYPEAYAAARDESLARSIRANLDDEYTRNWLLTEAPELILNLYMKHSTDNEQE